VRPRHFSTTEQGQVLIAAGPGPDLRCEERFASARFCRQYNELALAETARPLVELVNVGVDLQPCTFLGAGKTLHRGIEVWRAVIFGAFQVAGESRKLFNRGI
jgi:hypothetical protein